MSNRTNRYITIRQVKAKKNNSGSSPNMGKKAIYFTIGGRGLKFDQGKRSGGKNFWNPGTTKPSLVYTK